MTFVAADCRTISTFLSSIIEIVDVCNCSESLGRSRYLPKSSALQINPMAPSWTFFAENAAKTKTNRERKRSIGAKGPYNVEKIQTPTRPLKTCARNATGCQAMQAESTLRMTSAQDADWMMARSSAFPVARRQSAPRCLVVSGYRKCAS